MNKVEQIENLRKRIAQIDDELKRQREGKYMHFTGNNIVILLDRQMQLEKELAALTGTAESKEKTSSEEE